MSHMEGEIVIAAPAMKVFDYATNPDTWIEWYPLTTGIEWGKKRPAQKGETWVEHVEMHLGTTSLLLWKGEFDWRVIEADPGKRFVYDGVAKASGLLKGTSGGTAEIVYTLTETDAGTKFRRELTYKEPNFLLEVLDALVFKHIITHASEQALANMKRVLES